MSVRRLGVRAGDGAVHGARTFQGGVAGRLRAEEPSAAIGAAGAVLHYLTQHLRRDVATHRRRLSFYQPSDFLVLDSTTLRHLEILEPLHHDAPRNASLYGALNRTVTPMGARRLRDWLSQPLSERRCDRPAAGRRASVD